MKRPKSTRPRNEESPIKDYWIHIAVKEDLIDKAIDEYGPDYRTWSSAGNAILSDALAYRSYRNKLMSREANREQKKRGE